MAVSGVGQVNITTGNVLSAARQDPSLQLQQEHLGFIRQTNLRLPLVEQIGVRTETDRFELRRQEYLSRMSVNGIREIRRQRRLNEARFLEAESRQRIFLQEALAQRYEALLEYRQLQEELTTQRQLTLVYDDKIRVLRKLLEMNAEADVDELIKVEYDRDELALRITEAETRQTQLRQLIQEVAGQTNANWQLDTTGFIQPLQLEPVATTLSAGPLIHPEIIEKEVEIGRIDAEFQLEKAKSRQMLDFLQVRYQNRPEDPFNYDMAIGIGFNLPFQGSTRVKMNNLKIEKNAAYQDIQRSLLDLNRDIREARLRLSSLSNQYSQARDQWKESQAQFTLKQAATAGQLQDPMILLRARELVLKRELRLRQLERDMFDQYLEVLELSGQLSAEPLVNYLSTRLEKI